MSSTAVLPQTRGGYGRLQEFSIRFDCERVVLHLHPHARAGRLECNTARILLLQDHKPLPWAHWGEEFAAAMPAEIRQLQERAADADCVPRREAIRDRVSTIMPLYRLSPHSPTQPPPGPSTRSNAIRAGQSPADRPSTRPQMRSTPLRGDSGNGGWDPGPECYGADGQPPKGDPDTDTDADAESGALADLPDVAWVSARDSSRAPRDLEDQAARHHPGRHELRINATFRAITDLTAHRREHYPAVPGAHAVIEAHVRNWCEHILVEVVLAARGSSSSPEQLDALLSPTSFTAALLPMHLLNATLTKRLAQKLGTSQNAIRATTPRRCAIDKRGGCNGHAEDS